MRKSCQFFILTSVTLLLFISCNGQNNRKATAQLKLTADLKSSLASNLISQLNSNYIFVNTIPGIKSSIEKFINSNSGKKITDPGVFADSITSILQQIASDKHLGLKYKPGYSITEGPTPRPGMMPKEPENNEGRPPMQERRNEPVEYRMLNDSIGLLRIDIFDDLEIFTEKLDEAFSLFANASTIIIDIRNCGGGSPKAENYLISHFFKTATQFSSIFIRKGDNETEEKFIALSTPQKYLETKVYILTGEKTFSSAENFAYDMQSLKRAKVVGVKTKGGANPGREFWVSNNFFAFIPTGRSYSYQTKSNWEGVGILPDFLTDKDALEEALRIIKN